jgi:hypothetical protein
VSRRPSLPDGWSGPCAVPSYLTCPASFR